MTGDDPDRNPFIRWKQHVDAHIAATMQGIIGLPSVVSRNLNAQWTTPSTPDTSVESEPLASKMESNLRDWQQAAEWMSFALDSSYSPLSLRSLPPPVPRDLPPHVAPDAFTFEDAFEDLLTASSSGRMMDLNTRYEMRKMLRQMFPAGEPAFFWLQRLKSQGLLDTYFPRRRIQTYSQVGGWRDEQWERPPRREGLTEPDTSVPTGQAEQQPLTDKPSPPNLFDELDRLIKAAGKVLGDDLTRGQSPDNSHEPSATPGKEPDTFDELYSAINSAFLESGKSLTTLFKMIGEVAQEGPKDMGRRAGRQSETDAQAPPDSDKFEHVEATEDYVDEFGYRHTKRIVRTLNERGEEVGRETEYSVRPAEPSELYPVKPAKVSEPAGGARPDGSDKDMESQKRGWFWK